MFNQIMRQACYTNIFFNKLSKLTKLAQPIRCASNSAAYAGDGKTTVRVLNDEDRSVNFVNTYSNSGFRLANNLFVNGSIILFPTHVYSWGVRRGNEITPESLVVFDLIVPRIKIVIIGYGSPDEPFDASLPMKLKKKGISCEMLPTPNAVTTYNYLVSDSVHVAGAFLPVRTSLSPTKRDERGLHEWEEMYTDGRDVLPDLEKPLELPDTLEDHAKYKFSRPQGKKDKFD